MSEIRVSSTELSQLDTQTVTPKGIGLVLLCRCNTADITEMRI